MAVRNWTVRKSVDYWHILVNIAVAVDTVSANLIAQSLLKAQIISTLSMCCVAEERLLHRQCL